MIGEIVKYNGNKLGILKRVSVDEKGARFFVEDIKNQKIISTKKVSLLEKGAKNDK